jgi:endonuclease YncB( thermonuclease family)
VKKAAKIAISVVAVVAFILVFVGVGSNQQAEEQTDYQRELEESVSSESTSPSQPSAPEEQKQPQSIQEETPLPTMTPQSTVPVQPSSSSKSTDQSTFCGKFKCITDKVKRIIDGDTIQLKNYLIIRLSLTDAYEKNKPGGPAATAFTTKLCPVGSYITVDQDDKQPFDIYKRIVGKVYCGDKVLNSELLYNDHAKILTKYCKTSEFAKEDWAQKYGC